MAAVEGLVMVFKDSVLGKWPSSKRMHIDYPVVNDGELFISLGKAMAYICLW